MDDVFMNLCKPLCQVSRAVLRGLRWLLIRRLCFVVGEEFIELLLIHLFLILSTASEPIDAVFGIFSPAVRFEFLAPILRKEVKAGEHQHPRLRRETFYPIDAYAGTEKLQEIKALNGDGGIFDAYEPAA